MSENKLETLSANIDNYQYSDDEMNDFIKDEQMSDTWSRYHLVGDIMRNDVPEVLQFDLSAQIASAIADEPAILAPKNSSKFTQQIRAKVVQFAKPFGQMAIAASAAGLMVLGVQTNVAENDDILPSQVVQTTPFAGVAAPVSLNFQQNDRASQKQAFVEQKRRLHALLSDHKQQVKLSAVSVEENSNTNKVEEQPK
jgi:sigma-E factor negative regulatory protein RseA